MPLRTRTLPPALTRTRTRTCSFSCSARARGSALRPRAHHRRRALSDASRRLFHQQEPRHWCGTRPRACAHTQGLTQGASGRLCSRLDHSRRAHLFHFVHRPPRRAQDQPRPAEIRTELAPKRPPARPVLYPVSLSGLALLARCRIVLCPRPHHRHHSARPGHRRLRLPGRRTPPSCPACARGAHWRVLTLGCPAEMDCALPDSDPGERRVDARHPRGQARRPECGTAASLALCVRESPHILLPCRPHRRQFDCCGWSNTTDRAEPETCSIDVCAPFPLCPSLCIHVAGPARVH